MVRLVEQTKQCRHCGKRKPWSEFHKKVKWPDGTMRQPQSWCKDCQRTNARKYHARLRQQPGFYQRRYAKERAVMERDPERLATHREYQREYCRRRTNVTPDRYRFGRGNLAGQELPAASFADWLRYVMERDDCGIRETAAKLNLNEATLRRILNGKQRAVKLATVERAAIADGTHLREIVPSLYEGMAA